MVVWLPIKDYPDYEVSDDGQVRSLKFSKIRILKQQHTGADRAYRRIELWYNRIPARFYVHTLVLQAFIGPPIGDKNECNHKDSIKHNNHIDNLEWVTSSGNKIHGVINGLYPCGEQCSWTKLSAENIMTIKDMYANGMTHEAIAKHFPVKRRQISRILQGTRWKNYG
jgi:hypothetical protein